MTNALMNRTDVSLTQMERMASAIAKSNMFGVKTPDQALSLMLIAQSDGVHPARAMQEYHVIEGKPALRADAMLARFQAAGGCVRWVEMTDAVVRGEFTHPQGGTVTIDWTIERAKAAGLGHGDGLASGIDDHHGVRLLVHVAHAAKVAQKLLTLTTEGREFLL